MPVTTLNSGRGPLGGPADEEACAVCSVGPSARYAEVGDRHLLPPRRLAVDLVDLGDDLVLARRVFAPAARRPGSGCPRNCRRPRPASGFPAPASALRSPCIRRQEDVRRQAAPGRLEQNFFCAARRALNTSLDRPLCPDCRKAASCICRHLSPKAAAVCRRGGPDPDQGRRYPPQFNCTDSLSIVPLNSNGRGSPCLRHRCGYSSRHRSLVPRH